MNKLTALEPDARRILSQWLRRAIIWGLVALWFVWDIDAFNWTSTDWLRIAWLLLALAAFVSCTLAAYLAVVFGIISAGTWLNKQAPNILAAVIILVLLGFWYLERDQRLAGCQQDWLGEEHGADC